MDLSNQNLETTEINESVHATSPDTADGSAETMVPSVSQPEEDGPEGIEQNPYDVHGQDDDDLDGEKLLEVTIYADTKGVEGKTGHVLCQYYTSGELETESVDLPFVEMEYPDVLTEQRQPYTMKTAFFFANADTSGYNRIAKVNLPETPGDATQKYVYIGKEDKISHLAKVSQPNYIHLLFLRAFSSN